MKLKIFLPWIPCGICFLWIVLVVVSTWTSFDEKNALKYEESVLFQDVCNKGELKGTETCKQHKINYKKGSWGMTFQDLRKGGPEIFEGFFSSIYAFLSPIGVLTSSICVLGPSAYYLFPEIFFYIFRFFTGYLFNRGDNLRDKYYLTQG